MILLKDLINEINKRDKKFIKSDLFINKIKVTLRDFFPSLNKDDLDVIEVLTIFTIDFISFKYGFDSEKEESYLQWEQNNCGDMKGVILLLLPFIDDKNNSYLLRNMTDLNQFLYSNSNKYIPRNILDLNRDEILSTHFKYGNMGIGLLPFKPSKDEILLNLYENNEKKIYQVIRDNFYGLLQTLDIINGKSYINWVNIQPLNLNNYHESKISKNTTEYLKGGVEGIVKSLRGIDLDYNGLWLGDIYNVFRIKYYEEAKKIKWLIFPYEKSENDKKYLINILHELVNLEEIINHESKNYDDLDEEEQIKFKKKIENTLLTKLNDEIHLEVIKYTLIWLINNYSDKSKIKKDTLIVKFNLDSADEIEESNDDDFSQTDFKKINEISSEEISIGLQYIMEHNCGDLWNFLKESLKLFMASAYGKFLITKIDKKLVINDYYLYRPFNQTLQQKLQEQNVINFINLKNIYNISKSLSHTTEWILLDKHYISLNYITRKTFFEKIINEDNKDRWFNYSKNYKRQTKYGPSPTKKTIEKYEIDLLQEFLMIFRVIVFEELVSTGILNNFVPNLKITDKSKLPQNTFSLQKKRKELINEMFKINKEQWSESYYYLTNDQFKYIPKMKKSKKQITNQSDKYDEKEYFEMIAEDQEWTTFYAMNWISQISFFQHFIFHQIMYVTGATGQGKSTQVPKLLLYACKMYDYKSNANVICTQPRITPTVGNATRIAEELGLPIEQVSNTSSNKIKTDNYYVQFKYQTDSHSKDSFNDLTLQIVTDGSLLETLKKEPTLKVKVPIKKEEYSFNNNNLYDIIIVDEAHEHNINMDIIIALAKQTCYFNNQVRLIIVSATMDDDEPIYRSYFKIINDKLLYPIKSPIINPFVFERILLEPVHMDRRYHISPPGETTQYKVSEYYLENDANEMTERLNAKKIQELSYKKIIEICNKSTTGEILFFCTGEKEILEAVEYLNTNMPQGNIALPFFSKLNETYKDIITSINTKIYNIKNRRDRVHLEWNENYVEDLSVPAGLYKRSVIIATNVAEASVTIPGLAYVVDNGYAKENTFNRKLNISKLIVDKISESSRVQRRGRVGRIGDGTVYYMYTKDARKMVKPKYKITQQDISEMVLNLSSKLDLEFLKNPENYKYSKLIVSDIINPNMKDLHIKLDDILKNSYTYKKLLQLYEKNYKINGLFLEQPYFLFYFDDNKQKRGVVIEKSLYVYEDGQLFENLLDGTGQFYLIHPYENLIKRNVLNEIIMVDNKRTNHIPLTVYQYFLRSLIDKNLIVDVNADTLYLYKNDVNKGNRNYTITEVAENAIQLKTDFELIKIDEAITLIAASAMGCLQEVLEVRIFLNLLNNSLGNLVNENKTWDQFRELYTCSENVSDILFIYKVIKNLKNRFNKLLVFNLDLNNPKKNHGKKLDLYIEKEIIEFKRLLKKSKDPPKDYDGELWNKLKNLKNNGTLNSKKEELFISQTKTTDFLFNDLENYRTEIKYWAESCYFNPNIIFSFIRKLNNFYLSKIDKYNNNEVVQWSKNFSPNFNKCLTDYTLDEKILRSFLYGSPTQFTFNESNNLRTLMNFSLYEVNVATSFNSKKRTIETISTVSDFMFYLNFEEVDNLENKGRDTIKISFINKIKPIWLIPALPLVHNQMFNDISQDVKNDEVVIKYFDSYTINKLNKEFTNNWSHHYFIWDLSDKAPILHHFYSSIINVINKLIR